MNPPLFGLNTGGLCLSEVSLEVFIGEGTRVMGGCGACVEEVDYQDGDVITRETGGTIDNLAAKLVESPGFMASV